MSLTAVDEILNSLTLTLKKHDSGEAENALAHVEYLRLAVVTLLNNVTPAHLDNTEREKRLARVQRELQTCARAYFLKRF